MRFLFIHEPWFGKNINRLHTRERKKNECDERKPFVCRVCGSGAAYSIESTLLVLLQFNFLLAAEKKLRTPLSIIPYMRNSESLSFICGAGAKIKINKMHISCANSQNTNANSTSSRVRFCYCIRAEQYAQISAAEFAVAASGPSSSPSFCVFIYWFSMNHTCLDLVLLPRAGLRM